MNRCRVIAGLKKHTLDVILIVITLVSTLVMFISSADPIIAPLQGTVIQELLIQFFTGNQIAFNLAIAFVSGILIYVLVVRIPEAQKRRRLRRHLLKSYECFKADTLSIYLGCIHTSYSSSLLERLTKPEEFKVYFKENFAPGQNRWHGVANALDEYTIRLIVLELEVLRQELLFVISTIDVSDDEALGFFRRLSQVIYRARLWSPDYDDVKSMMGFLWSLHTGWNFVAGYPETDPILAMVRKL